MGKIRPGMLSEEAPDADGVSAGISPHNGENGFPACKRTPKISAAAAAEDEVSFLKSELEKYRRITSNIDEFLWSLTSEDGVEDVFYTESIKKVTGYTAEEVINMPGRGLALVHAADAFAVRKQLTDFENDPLQKTLRLQYRILNKSQETLWLKEEISAERDARGRIKCWDGIVLNITELKKTEEVLRKSQENLTGLNEAKDRFISIISHDLRAPFTSILGFAEILLFEQSLPEAEKHEYLNYIYESSQSQLKLVNYLLDWSRLQTGSVKFVPQRLKATTIVYNCVSSLTGNAIRKNIEIKVNVPESISIQADEKLITQAVTNLLSNAIKFTEENKSIEVTVNNFKKGFIEFTVKDEGVGISDANKRKIFHFDQKFSSEGTKGEKGTGLGLTLVKEIVEKHGGDIWFYSETGKGSEFHFIIPEAPNIVLLVEDDPPARSLWVKLVKKALPDFEIIETSNGYEAIGIIQEKVPSLVITDHSMPLMNGIQLIESMRKRDESNKIPVIVVAGTLTEELMEKYYVLGAEAILAKPVDVKEFMDALSVLIR
ncbi:MAG: response regulator [Ignavibacteria bacterium]|jgi:PAS domain S-box-containing protein|nr:response regulator [Ignavibacteria bacterium]MCU7502631.1 response regulator [Ignavibacteria bacterium]MCU7515166.1 response regulator [Ignavibacteria bacterium]